MKIMKILVGILIISIVIMLIINPIYSEAYEYSTEIEALDGLTAGGNINEAAKNIVGAIIEVLRTVALGVAIIMIIVLAMKYMSSAPNDRAEIKKHAIVYVVGAVVFFASSSILKIIADFASSNIK